MTGNKEIDSTLRTFDAHAASVEQFHLAALRRERERKGLHVDEAEQAAESARTAEDGDTVMSEAVIAMHTPSLTRTVSAVVDRARDPRLVKRGNAT